MYCTISAHGYRRLSIRDACGEYFSGKSACRLSLRNMGTVRPQARCNMHVKFRPKCLFLWALKHCEREARALQNEPFMGFAGIHFLRVGCLLIAQTSIEQIKPFRIKGHNLLMSQGWNLFLSGFEVGVSARRSHSRELRRSEESGQCSSKGSLVCEEPLRSAI